MANNKVVFGNETIMDITDSTVTPEKLKEGEIAYNSAGQKITGTLVTPSPINIVNLGGALNRSTTAAGSGLTLGSGYNYIVTNYTSLYIEGISFSYPSGTAIAQAKYTISAKKTDDTDFTVLAQANLPLNNPLSIDISNYDILRLNISIMRQGTTTGTISFTFKNLVIS